MRELHVRLIASVSNHLPVDFCLWLVDNHIHDEAPILFAQFFDGYWSRVGNTVPISTREEHLAFYEKKYQDWRVAMDFHEMP